MKHVQNTDGPAVRMDVLAVSRPVIEHDPTHEHVRASFEVTTEQYGSIALVFPKQLWDDLALMFHPQGG